MLPLSGFDDVDLATGRGESAQLPPASEEHQLRRVAKVKAHAAPVGPAILTALGPHEVGLVGEAPTLKNGKTLRQQGVGYPQVTMALGRHELGDG